MADPEARDLIQKAFDADIVETFFIGPKDVEAMYREGPQAPPKPSSWLESYRQILEESKESERRMEQARQREQEQDRLRKSQKIAPFEPPARREPLYDAPEPPPQPVETIRKTGPRLGRNDPCWCGSGKKYKNCHLRQDQSS